MLSAAFLGLPQHPRLLREGHVLETGGFPRVLSQPGCTQTTPGVGIPGESPAPVKIPDFCHVTPVHSDQSS